MGKTLMFESYNDLKSRIWLTKEKIKECVDDNCEYNIVISATEARDLINFIETFLEE